MNQDIVFKKHDQMRSAAKKKGGLAVDDVSWE